MVVLYVITNIDGGRGVNCQQGTDTIPIGSLLFESAFTSPRPIYILRPNCTNSKDNFNFTVNVGGGFQLSKGYHQLPSFDFPKSALGTCEVQETFCVSNGYKCSAYSSEHRTERKLWMQILHAWKPGHCGAKMLPR